MRKPGGISKRSLACSGHCDTTVSVPKFCLRNLIRPIPTKLSESHDPVGFPFQISAFIKIACLFNFSFQWYSKSILLLAISPVLTLAIPLIFDSSVLFSARYLVA